MESIVKVDMKVGFGNLICMGSMIMVDNLILLVATSTVEITN